MSMSLKIIAFTSVYQVPDDRLREGRRRRHLPRRVPWVRRLRRGRQLLHAGSTCGKVCAAPENLFVYAKDGTALFQYSGDYSNKNQRTRAFAKPCVTLNWYWNVSRFSINLNCLISFEKRYCFDLLERLTRWRVERLKVLHSTFQAQVRGCG